RAGRDGRVDPPILCALRMAGATEVYRIGGIQAIGAMAYGTETVAPVDKIVGPGGIYVAAAKRLVYGEVAIDMVAGPSEIAVLADDSADPVAVAADLLSQAEHGSDSQVILFTTDLRLARAVEAEATAQLERLPRREIALKALESSRIIVLSNDEELMDMVNRYAPEHLIIATQNYRELAGMVINAGSVFLGPITPESAGDYASGTNHTLPTSGYARQMGGLSLESFIRNITFQEITPTGLSQIGPVIIEMARAEGLEGHARAVEVRMTADGGQRTEEQDKIKDERLGRGVERMVRPNILSLVPYSSARDEYAGREGIFLDANENPFDSGLNRYPDPRQRELRQRVAVEFSIRPDRVFLGNGSDEAIDLLIRIFCEPRLSRIITMSPSYGMYAVAARIQDVGVDPVLLNSDFSVDVDRMLSAAGPDTRILFLCSPNNPTGNQIPIDQIRWAAERFPGIVVVDEAYADFASGPSAISLIDSYSNLVILRTFSKAWGMAAARVGMAFADPFIIGLMDKVKYPYNLSAPAALEILTKLETGREMVTEAVREIIHQREWLKEQLQSLPCVRAVYPSEGNFLLVKVVDARATYAHLLDRRIVVRDRSSQPLCDNCLRITVGTPEENQRLLMELTTDNRQPTTDNRQLTTDN
ncbi:MAG: histidinol dehydrogenase, partial [Bacteroidales bacterium]